MFPKSYPFPRALRDLGPQDIQASHLPPSREVRCGGLETLPFTRNVFGDKHWGEWGCSWTLPLKKKRENKREKKKSSTFLTPSMFLLVFLASHLNRGNIVIPFPVQLAREEGGEVYVTFSVLFLFVFSFFLW